jgi:hypothetical protein
VSEAEVAPESKRRCVLVRNVSLSFGTFFVPYPLETSIALKTNVKCRLLRYVVPEGHTVFHLQQLKYRHVVLCFATGGSKK